MGFELSGIRKSFPRPGGGAPRGAERRRHGRRRRRARLPRRRLGLGQDDAPERDRGHHAAGRGPRRRRRAPTSRLCARPRATASARATSATCSRCSTCCRATRRSRTCSFRFTSRGSAAATATDRAAALLDRVGLGSEAREQARPRCRSGSSSAWRSRAPSPAGPRSSSPTSRPRTSIPRTRANALALLKEVAAESGAGLARRDPRRSRQGAVRARRSAGAARMSLFRMIFRSLAQRPLGTCADRALGRARRDAHVRDRRARAPVQGELPEPGERVSRSSSARRARRSSSS